jgi:hypothetical protein
VMAGSSLGVMIKPCCGPAGDRRRAPVGLAAFSRIRLTRTSFSLDNEAVAALDFESHAKRLSAGLGQVDDA